MPYAGMKLSDACLYIVNLLSHKTWNAIGVFSTKSLERFEVIMHLFILSAQTLLPIRFAQKSRSVKLYFTRNTIQSKSYCYRFEIYYLLYCGIGVAMLVSSFYYWKRESEPVAEPGA